MKDWAKVIKNLTLLTQFGLSLITPLLLCLGICWWLTDRFRLGGWIYLIGFIFGLGGSFMTAYKLYLSVTAKQQPSDRRDKPFFNSHK